MNTLAEIAGVIRQKKSAVIFTHARPDGDTLGGAAALSLALTALGIKNEIVNEGACPEKYLFMRGAKEIKTAPTLEAQTFICVDTSDIPRLGVLQTVYLANVKKVVTVNIDHHVSNTRYATYNFVRQRASNCENIADLIKELGVAINKEIAECLLTGMVTDSGGFSHSDVNGETLRAAALCVDAGADIQKVTYESYKKKTRANAGFYLAALSTLRYELEGKLAVVAISQDDVTRFGVGQDATDGIVDFGLNVDTVEVSVCLLEMKKGQHKVSLRSQGKANVNEMARAFGGGGHVLAAGCMLFGSIEEIVDKLCYATRQQLDL